LDDGLDPWKGLSATERAMASYSAEDRADFQARHNTGSEQRHRYEDGFHTDSATHQTNQLSYRHFSPIRQSPSASLSFQLQSGSSGRSS
jgi:hypothetical protein